MKYPLSVVWSYYNAPDALAPFVLPFLVWTLAYGYTQYRKQPFHQWHTLHNIHNFGAIALGLLSLHYKDDSILNERIGILWSLGYFMTDIIDCGVRRDGPYFVHAVLCLGLGASNYWHPVCRHLRTNSQAALCELSNPFMHWAKRTRKPLHFVLFVVVYTVCRIVWIPYMIVQCRNAGMEWTHPVVLAVLGFYALNWYWYIKMGNILLEGLWRGKRVDQKKQV